MRAAARLALGAGAAAGLFVPLFLQGRLGPLDFWWGMAAANCLLLALAARLDPLFPGRLYADLRYRAGRKALIGLAAAAGLYLVFLAGDGLARLLLPGAAGAIGEVYALKAGASTLRVALLMGLVFGPGEELFWRGFLQHGLAARFGRRAGLLLAAGLYAGVHAGSGNAMLLLAALVCGLAWGWLYLRFGSMTVNAASHTLWDLAVFLVVPFQGL